MARKLLISLAIIMEVVHIAQIVDNIEITNEYRRPIKEKGISMKTSREITLAKNKYTRIFAIDERGPGNGNHSYTIRYRASYNGELRHYDEQQVIRFQRGPIHIEGVNGIQNEDLLAIVADRLLSFQEGDYACKENEKALLSTTEALRVLQERTADRVERGVEGTNEN